MIEFGQTALPWVAVLGFFGMILRLRVSGDPALWRRVEALEKKLEDERISCDERIAQLEGYIRQLQQQQASFGHISDKPLKGPLHTAFRPDCSDKDGDLIAKLNRQPSRERKR